MSNRCTYCPVVDCDKDQSVYECIGKLQEYATRPQGEWIEIGLAFNSYKCSVCGRMLVNITNGKNTVAKSYPYCHCGARMTGARSLRREDII